MFVEKIEIPAFRVLRDVVLEFDRSYHPTIFPMGSENGGGKSTLLQLIFVLLHCSADPERFVYLKNLLASDSSACEEDERLIARLSIRMGEETHRLEFLSLHNRFLVNQKLEDLEHGFTTEARLTKREQALETVKQRLERYQNVNERSPRMERESLYEAIRMLDEDEYRLPRRDIRTVADLKDYLRPAIQQLQQEVVTYTAECKALSDDIERIQGLMVALNYKYITTYTGSASSDKDVRAIVCRTAGRSASKTEELLRDAAAQVFLLGPSNQQYLFLGKDTRRALQATASRSSKRAITKRARPQIEYLSGLDKAEAAMEGFIAYDWLSIEPLVDLFLSARDEDFQHVVATGNYGNRYVTLQQEVNGLLLGKTVRPLVDSLGVVVGVEFIVTDATGTKTVVGTEDLSQGELKRLMIYAWLRANHAKDSLVLIDEIESSFHPDWQLGIVRELDSWAPSNQYILATHSYELCQALTPRHVRMLQPPLRRGKGGDELKT